MSESERDQRLDAAWRIASREEPPPALDATIRAAARQAVGAGPERRRNKHWWYPLAAAATVAVLAVGIAQLTPPEQVAPAVVAEGGPSGTQRDGERQSAAIAGKPFAPPATTPRAAVPGPAQPAPAPPGAVSADALKSVLPRVVPAKPGPESSVGRERELSRQDQRAASAPEAAVAANTAPAAAAAAPPGTLRSEPFPAAPAADERRAAFAEEPTPVAIAPAGAVGAPPSQQARTAAAKVSRADAAPLQAPPARRAEEWVKRIRDLKTEGRLEEAAKELAAFRAAYGERADALLPADLQPHPR
jgi:hypothetical protein